jgi:DNA-binding MarR family transcriptional regulator
MQDYPGLLIAAARRKITQAVSARLAGHRLNPHQFWITIAIAEHRGLSQAELAARLRMDAPTASRAVAGLVTRGLVRANEDPADRRRTRLVLTAAGERLVRELAPIAREVREAVIAGMSEPEVAALRSSLQRVLQNLEQLEAAPVQVSRRRRA